MLATNWTFHSELDHIIWSTLQLETIKLRLLLEFRPILYLTTLLWRKPLKLYSREHHRYSLGGTFTKDFYVRIVIGLAMGFFDGLRSEATSKSTDESLVSVEPLELDENLDLFFSSKWAISQPKTPRTKTSCNLRVSEKGTFPL